jgi:hypothetical protein
MEVNKIIKKIRSKQYYVDLLKILVLEGLLDIVQEETKDTINYVRILLKVVYFLKKNKYYYKRFSSDTFEKIIILSLDEIFKVKFQIDLDEAEICAALELLKSSYLIRNFLDKTKDFFIRAYYKFKCKTCLGKDVIELELDSI